MIDLSMVHQPGKSIYLQKCNLHARKSTKEKQGNSICSAPGQDCCILLPHFCQVSASPSCVNCWHVPCLPIASVADQQELPTSASHADDIPLPNLLHSSEPKPDAFPDLPGLHGKKFRAVWSTHGVQRNSQVLAPNASHQPFGSYTLSIFFMRFEELLSTTFWYLLRMFLWDFDWWDSSAPETSRVLVQFSFHLPCVQTTHLGKFSKIAWKTSLWGDITWHHSNAQMSWPPQATEELCVGCAVLYW